MGKVVEKVKLTSLFEPEKSVEVDAIIDTGATMLVLPQDVIEELGLRKIGERRVRYANNQIQIKPVYRGVILELNGRDGIFDVLGEVEGSEPLVGQIVLEALDLIVDPITKTVIPNPRSPDMPMTEILMATPHNSGHTATLRPVQIRQSRNSHVRKPLGEILRGDKNACLPKVS
ncbi:MAG: aspartyl protease family protein [Candidatus Methanospirare jalkutatii]|nr:aspartyl protease family protein [Candidatus Methanospirare jalkutatii]